MEFTNSKDALLSAILDILLPKIVQNTKVDKGATHTNLERIRHLCPDGCYACRTFVFSSNKVEDVSNPSLQNAKPASFATSARPVIEKRIMRLLIMASDGLGRCVLDSASTLLENKELHILHSRINGVHLFSRHLEKTPLELYSRNASQLTSHGGHLDEIRHHVGVVRKWQATIAALRHQVDILFASFILCKATGGLDGSVASAEARMVTLQALLYDLECQGVSLPTIVSIVIVAICLHRRVEATQHPPSEPSSVMSSGTETRGTPFPSQPNVALRSAPADTSSTVASAFSSCAAKSPMSPCLPLTKPCNRSALSTHHIPPTSSQTFNIEDTTSKPLLYSASCSSQLTLAKSLSDSRDLVNASAHSSLCRFAIPQSCTTMQYLWHILPFIFVSFIHLDDSASEYTRYCHKRTSAAHNMSKAHFKFHQQVDPSNDSDAEHRMGEAVTMDIEGVEHCEICLKNSQEELYGDSMSRFLNIVYGRFPLDSLRRCEANHGLQTMCRAAITSATYLFNYFVYYPLPVFLGDFSSSIDGNSDSCISKFRRRLVLRASSSHLVFLPFWWKPTHAAIHDHNTFSAPPHNVTHCCCNVSCLTEFPFEPPIPSAYASSTSLPTSTCNLSSPSDASAACHQTQCAPSAGQCYCRWCVIRVVAPSITHAHGNSRVASMVTLQGEERKCTKPGDGKSRSKEIGNLPPVGSSFIPTLRHCFSTPQFPNKCDSGFVKGNASLPTGALLSSLSGDLRRKYPTLTEFRKDFVAHMLGLLEAVDFRLHVCPVEWAECFADVLKDCHPCVMRNALRLIDFDFEHAKCIDHNLLNRQCATSHCDEPRPTHSAAYHSVASCQV